MKQKMLFVMLTGLLLSFAGHAQKDAGLKSFLSKTGEFVLPVQSVETITKRLKTTPVVDTNENDGEPNHTWTTKSGLVVTGFPDIHDAKLRIITIEAKDGRQLSGLPYGLVLNGTSRKACEVKFKSYIRSGIANDADALHIKKGKYYVGLSFDDNNKLKSVTVSTIDLHTSAG